MIQVPIGGRGELESPEADVIQCFVVYTEGFVRVFHELVHGEGGVVGLHNRVRHLNMHRQR